ncbi:MAG: PD-(D/E)XK nuclease family transposase, partial [Lachnospiraceae bacterium]|nr:PD-(D/E)XK nuclease family transposase [Lachnospiraceae bacterium]
MRDADGTEIRSFEQIMGEKCTREEALGQLQLCPHAYETFLRFRTKEKEQILQFLQGENSLTMTYNNIFLYIMNPDTHRERLESLLSALIGEEVHIRQVLPSEGNRLAEQGSLVIMDVIAELSDGSIVDVEMQKVGYEFSGQRSNCYAADMIMRQYNRVKSRRGKDFSYRDLKTVYLFVLMEKSPNEFHTYPYAYIHGRQTTYSSGIVLPDLAKITYISLDTFRSLGQNITTKLDAWLTFLSCDDAAHITELVRSYPDFMEYYKDVAVFRTNPEEVITMFSEALAILDRNTEKYMIEEMKEELDAIKKEIGETKQELGEAKQ